jgi:hypothetical protein
MSNVRFLVGNQKEAANFLLIACFNPEDWGNTFFRNTGKLLPYYTALHPWRLYSSSHVTYGRKGDLFVVLRHDGTHSYLVLCKQNSYAYKFTEDVVWKENIQPQWSQHTELSSVQILVGVLLERFL